MILDLILASGLIASIGVLVYLVKKISTAHSDLNEFFLKTSSLEKENLVLKQAVDQWQQAYSSLGVAKDNLQKELQAESAARATAEKQRDALLGEIAKNGNIKALAGAVNKELDDLRKIGFDVKKP
jgi:FKBP-type peptidyl-prolyl cis-trans isomerase (trigger factor)